MAKRKRGNGEGSIIKLKGRNSWRVTVSYYDSSGNRKRKSSCHKTKTEALEKLAKYQSDISLGTIKENSEQTLSDALDDWLRFQAKEKVSKATYRRYAGLIKDHITPRIGAVRIQKAKPEHVQFVLNEMKESGQSSSSRRQCYTVFNQTFKRYIVKRVIDFNPCDAVQCPAKDHTEHKILASDQIIKIIDKSKSYRLHALVVVAFTTGMRTSELIALKWEDIDLEKGYLSVRRKAVDVSGEMDIGKPKTKSSKRNIKLPEITIAALKKHRKKMDAEKKHDSEWVFCDTIGGLLDRRNLIERTFKKVMEDAEIPFVNIHGATRHSLATALLKDGVHPKMVQEILGHSSIAVTLDIYSHVLPTMQEETAKRLDDMFGN